MRVPPRADGTKAKNYTAKSTRASDGMRDGHSRRAAARDEEAEDPRDHRSRDRPRRAKAQAAVAARRRRSRRCQVGDIRHQRVQKPGGKLSPLVVCRRQGLFENVRCFSHSRVVLAGVFNARRSRGDAETSDSTDVPAETRRQFVGASVPRRRDGADEPTSISRNTARSCSPPGVSHHRVTDYVALQHRNCWPTRPLASSVRFR